MSKRSAREIVVDILEEVDSKDAYSNIVLNRVLNSYTNLSAVDKGFITEVTNGTIKYSRKIDYIINSFANTPTNKMKPFIRSVLRMSVYQIVFLDKVPDSAVCNEAVKIVKKRKMGKLSGFVNGVLRNIARKHTNISYPDKNTDPVEYLGVVYSFPDWIIELWLKDYPFDLVEKLCLSLNESPEITIRTNNLIKSKDDVKKLLKEARLNVEDGNLAPEALKIYKGASVFNLKGFKDGYFTVQDESSMLVSHILNPQKGDMVLDVCAAPGGKSSHIAELMSNQGTIISADIYEHKLDLIESTSKRMGHSIIQTVMQDARVENPDYIEKFDRVLVDAPCSGLGILHKKSDIRWNKELSDIKNLVKIQKEILKVSAKYVKPGGIMVYSTCTISHAENQQMVEWILESLDFELEEINSYIPKELHNEDSKQGYIQIFPFDAGTDGFFMARLRKRG
ncbi:MAG: 16S rRNA (cytosine(967)-C(5))-methyltransferase RsmB [Epulopiscium sp.]|nr:16S rRNA (cytosine(967)-C(5))-methyltransferase RsmB [Candidatus Epulonipiscium sp.]